MSADFGRGRQALGHMSKLILSERELENNNLVCSIHVLEVAHRLKRFPDQGHKSQPVS